MVRFIDDHRDAHGIESICAVVPIAPLTYFRHKTRSADPTRRSARAQRDGELRAAIQRVWDDNQRAAEGVATAAARRRPRGPLHGRAADARDGPARSGAWPSVEGHDAVRFGEIGRAHV